MVIGEGVCPMVHSCHEGNLTEMRVIKMITSDRNDDGNHISTGRCPPPLVDKHRALSSAADTLGHRDCRNHVFLTTAPFGTFLSVQLQHTITCGFVCIAVFDFLGSVMAVILPGSTCCLEKEKRG